MFVNILFYLPVFYIILEFNLKNVTYFPQNVVCKSGIDANMPPKNLFAWDNSHNLHNI